MSLQPESKLPGVGTTIFTVMSAKAAQHQAINLSQGFPDFAVPERLQQLLSEAMAAGHNQYPPMTGVAELRTAVADKIGETCGRTPDPDSEITITSGATEALFCAIHAVVRAGDEVILFDPAYDSYQPAVELAGGRVVRLPLSEPDFHIDWDRVRAVLSPRTRLIIINSPHNPCGSSLSSADLDTLAGLLDGSPTLVLSDEVYEHICFDAAGHQSVLAHAGLAERSFAVFSFGKTYHCTGWKLGYCVAPPALSAEFRKVHQYVTFTSFAPAQHALAGFMREHPEHHRELSAFYRAKRDRFNAHLEAAGFELAPSSGTYFQLADYRAHADVDDLQFVDQLIDRAGIAAIPISVFYPERPHAQRLVRFCFAKSDATLDEAGERLRAL